MSQHVAVVAFLSTMILIRMTSRASQQQGKRAVTAAIPMRQVPIQEMEANIKRALSNVGHSEENAQIICDTIMYAELRGNNQGIVKLVARDIDANPNAKPMQITRENIVTAHIDGGGNNGMVVVSKAVRMCIDKAKVSGVAVVACSGYASGTGALGVWAGKIASEKLVGIVMSQCNEYVAPHGSYEPIFGTNPLAIGVPSSPRNQVLDMATSAYAYFGVVTAQKQGLQIPMGVAYDKDGQDTTDPVEAIRGALRVFDRSYKGSHLALMVELLAGALTGASMNNKLAAKNWGSLVIAIDPEMFGPAEDFEHRTEEMCRRVKEAKKLPSFEEEIYLPGERGDRLADEQMAEGRLRISSVIYEQLIALASLKK